MTPHQFANQGSLIPHISVILLTYLIVVLAAEDDSSKSREFILDVQQLLQHNQNFYNKYYGTTDHLINLKFFEAKDAAEGIFQRPDIFAEKVSSLQKLINAKVATFSSLEEHLKLAPASSSRSNAKDKMLLVLASTIGGFVKFQN